MLTLRRRLEREEGVTLILFAFLMVALLGLAGLVVDFGLVRTDRQRNKSAADVAVAAGLQALNVSNAVVPARGACEALDYLQVNHPELSGLTTSSGWTDGNGATIVGDPCDSTTPSAAHLSLWNTACSATAPGARPSFVWFTGSTGTIDVKIRAGFDANDINSGGFADEAAHSDKGAADQYGCDQLAVIVTERENAGLGRVVGGDQLQSTIRSVGRLTIEDSSEAAVALLLIEPKECGALEVSGAASGAKVHVLGTGTRPGIIHADSIGDPSTCSGSAKVLRGDKPGAITAKQAPLGSPRAAGMISITALNANPGYAYDGDINVVAEGGMPQGGAAKGRRPVDERYLGLATPSAAAYGMTKLQSDVNATFSGLTVANAGSRGFDASYSCGSLPPSGTTITGTKVFIECDIEETTTFAGTVTDVVIKGKLRLNGDVLTIPNARNVYVYGDTGNGAGVDIGSGGVLLVNTNGITTPNVCTTRQAEIDAASAPKPVTKFVVANGFFNAGSTALMKMCGTTLFLMDEGLPTSIGTTPADNSHNGAINVVGQATLEWTAPNTTPNFPTAAEIANLEDLAFWTETSGGNSIGSTNTSVNLKGIFFTPNANAFKIAAGSAGITADAQFITRKLVVAGGGTLSMTADPNNSIPIKIISGYSLVR